MLKTATQACEDFGSTTYCERIGDERRHRPLSHYKDAIAEYLVEHTRWLDIRPLWERGDTRFFRVNLWKTDLSCGEQRIARSLFIAVQDTYDGLCVREA